MLPPTPNLPAIQIAQAVPPPSFEQADTTSSEADFRRKPYEPGQIIGQAKLQPTGEILVVLDEHFLTHDSVLHTSYIYKPGTPGYNSVVSNLGKFSPGEFKTVYARGMWAPTP